MQASDAVGVSHQQPGMTTGSCGLQKTEDTCVPPYNRYLSDLSFRPRLGLKHDVVCILITWLLCAILLRSTESKSSPLMWVIVPSVLFLFVRKLLIEGLHTLHQRREEELADPDSLFMTVDGIRVHYKYRKPSHGNIRRGIHLCHGTKNNLYAWDVIHQELANTCDALVTAADMTGHGLTKRPLSSKMYRRSFNGRLCRSVIEHELQQNGVHAVDGIVLIGNSIGSLVHMIETIRKPEGIAGVIVVSPVLPISEDIENADDGILDRILSIAWHIWKLHILLGLKELLFQCMLPLMFLLMRPKIPLRVSWTTGLAGVYATEEMLDRCVDRFRLPTLVRGFEYGMLMFDHYCLYEAYHSRSIADIWMKRPRKTFTQAFAETIKKHDIRVLIVHGENDTKIPVSSSAKFCEDIPSIEFIRYPCGHMSNEELPDRFVRDVVNFLSKT